MSSQFVYKTWGTGTMSTGREDSSGIHGLSSEMIKYTGSMDQNPGYNGPAVL